MSEVQPPEGASPPAVEPIAAPVPFEPAAAPARKRKGPPWWVWLIVGGVVLAVIVVVSGATVFFKQQAKGYSPGYDGAPVEASDASSTTIVSEDATVAYDIEAEWVDAATYVPTAGVEAGLQEGQSITGLHFTADPQASVPQFVMVFEGDTEQIVNGSLESAMKGYLAGARATGAEFDDPTLTPLTTSLDLEGVEVRFEPTVSGTVAPSRAAVLGHGDRLVFVQWMSYDGPVDDAGFEALINSLRIDE